MAGFKTLTFPDIMKQVDEGQTCAIPRAILGSVFPHRGVALVASYAVMANDSCSLVLEPEDFGPYMEGHPWLFPQHWLGEMAAQVAGLWAQRAVLQKKSVTECAEFNLPMTLKGGDWEKQPPAVDQRIFLPVTATVLDFKIHIGAGNIKYEASVEIEQGDRRAVYTGIVVLIRKGAKQESSGE